MIDSYPDTLATIGIHLDDPWACGWGNMRASLYGVSAIPFSSQDGLYDAWPISTYETKFLARQAVPTDVTIDMKVYGSGANWVVQAQVCILLDGIGKTMKVWMAQVLDHYGPGTGDFDRNTARTGSTGVNVTLAAGECETIYKLFVLDAVSLASPDNVKIFAWAQDPTFVSGWAEIHQAAKALAPFAGILYDNFDDGTTSAWSATVP